MQEIVEDWFSYIATAIGSIIVFVFSNNSKLKEHITNYMLRKMNQTKIQKIPLSNHTLFYVLKQHNTEFTLFLLESKTKAHFYNIYIEIVFSVLAEMSKEIIDLIEKDNNKNNSKKEQVNFTGKIQNEIFTIINEKLIDNEELLNETLTIPDNIVLPFNQWRGMLRNSLRSSLTEILNDDLINNDYFIVYRTFDILVAHCKTLLYSGALEFSRMNGAFDKLDIMDIDPNIK